MTDLAEGAPGGEGARAPSAAPTTSFGTGALRTSHLGPFILEDATELPELHVAWRHDGLAPGIGPQILVVHALTGSADAAGDWWEPLIGPGRALDTTSAGVLGVNLLGSRYGSTGPLSVNPDSGTAWERAFPAVSTRDQARAIWSLLDHIGIDRLALVVGGSLGGMVALEVALARPIAVEHVMPIAAPAATGPMAIAWNQIQVALIERLGTDGLALARQLAMTTYRSETDFLVRFGRARGSDGRHAVVSYLDHQGAKLVDRFDGDTYRVLAGAMDRHDIGAERGGVDAALVHLAVADVALTGVGIVDDLLYGPRQVRALVNAATSAGVAARYREIQSTKGHDAFLVEWQQLTEILGEALATARPPATRPRPSNDLPARQAAARTSRRSTTA